MAEEQPKQYCQSRGCFNKNKLDPGDFQLPGQLWWTVDGQDWFVCVACRKVFHRECYFLENMAFLDLSEREVMDNMKRYFECPLCECTWEDEYPGERLSGRW